MTYFEPALGEHPGDRIWALQEASKETGFTPHTKSVAGFLVSLEMSGLVCQSARGPVWHITERGRAELARLEASQYEQKQDT